MVFRTQRNLDRQRTRAQAGADHLDAAAEIGARAVHLVDVTDARHVVIVGQTPVGLGLRLDAGDAVEHHDRAVEDAQGAVHFDGEIDVAGGVDDGDLLTAPESGDGGALDRDPALLLLLHIVGGGRGLQILRLMDVDDGVLASRIVEDALGRGRLTCVHMGDDADVSDVGERRLTGHHKISMVV